MKYTLTIIFILIATISFGESDSRRMIDNTILEIKDGKEIFGRNSDWWDKYSSGLIAALTVFLSLGISVWQARKTTKATRTNSISEARIQWIQEVRPLMSRLMTLVYEVKYEISVITKDIDLNTKQIKKDLNEHEKNKILKIVERFKVLQYESAEALFNLKLLLNPNEAEHESFINLIENYLNEIEKKSKDESYVIKIHENEIVHAGNLIIKNAWEQAKNEGNKKKYN